MFAHVQDTCTHLNTSFLVSYLMCAFFKGRRRRRQLWGNGFILDVLQWGKKCVCFTIYIDIIYIYMHIIQSSSFLWITVSWTKISEPIWPSNSLAEVTFMRTSPRMTMHFPETSFSRRLFGKHLELEEKPSPMFWWFAVCTGNYLCLHVFATPFYRFRFCQEFFVFSFGSPWFVLLWTIVHAFMHTSKQASIESLNSSCFFACLLFVHVFVPSCFDLSINQSVLHWCLHAYMHK